MDSRDLIDADLAELATKSDLGELKTSISDLRAGISGRLWVMGVGIVGLTVALMKLLPG